MRFKELILTFSDLVDFWGPQGSKSARIRDTPVVFMDGRRQRLWSPGTHHWMNNPYRDFPHSNDKNIHRIAKLLDQATLMHREIADYEAEKRSVDIDVVIKWCQYDSVTPLSHFLTSGNGAYVLYIARSPREQVALLPWKLLGRCSGVHRRLQTISFRIIGQGCFKNSKTSCSHPGARFNSVSFSCPPSLRNIDTKCKEIKIIYKPKE